MSHPPSINGVHLMRAQFQKSRDEVFSGLFKSTHYCPESAEDGLLYLMYNRRL
jgi:hypothetical protein